MAKHAIALEVARSMGVASHPQHMSQRELYNALNAAGYIWNTKTQDWEYSKPKSEDLAKAVTNTDYTCLWSAGDYSKMPDAKLVKLYRDADREYDKMRAADAFVIDLYEQSDLLSSLRNEIEKRGIEPWDDK